MTRLLCCRIRAGSSRRQRGDRSKGRRAGASSLAGRARRDSRWPPNASRPRAYPFTDYTYGYAETTALRLRALEVFHGQRRLRIYLFAYQNSMSGSQLASVDEEGENGLHKPRLTLGFVPFTHEGRLVTMASPPPVDGLSNNQATLEDVNGDGLPDLLVGVAGDYRYYENLDGVSWASTPRALPKP